MRFLLKLSEKNYYYVAYQFSTLYLIWNLSYFLNSFILRFLSTIVISIKMRLPCTPYRACTRTRMRTHTRMYFVHIHTHTRISWHPYKFARTHTCMHACLHLHALSLARTYSCMHSHSSALTLLRTCTLSQSRSNIDARTHTQTQSHSLCLTLTYSHSHIHTLAGCRICKHTRMHAHAHIRAYIKLNTLPPNCTCTHAHTHINTPTHIYTHTFACTHTRMHTHTHMYKWSIFSFICITFVKPSENNSLWTRLVLMQQCYCGALSNWHVAALSRLLEYIEAYGKMSTF